MSPVTKDRAPTMTRKDWATLEEVCALESALLATRTVKLKKNEKEAVKKHAKLYGRILRDKKAAQTIEKCFGDPAVLTTMRLLLDEVSQKVR